MQVGYKKLFQFLSPVLLFSNIILTHILEMNEHDEKTKQYSSWESLKYNRWTYNGMPIFRTSNGNEKSAKNRRVREIGDKGIVFEWGEKADFWFKLSEGLKKWGFEKLQFDCSLMVNKQDAVL